MRSGAWQLIAQVHCVAFLGWGAFCGRVEKGRAFDGRELGEMVKFKIYVCVKMSIVFMGVGFVLNGKNYEYFEAFNKIGR